jgi:hypothetical protein
MEISNSYSGTPDGRRMSMATGEVSGIMDIQRAKEPFGFSAMGIIIMIVNINGMVTDKRNCCESVSASTAEPTAAYNDAYIK